MKFQIISVILLGLILTACKTENASQTATSLTGSGKAWEYQVAPRRVANGRLFYNKGDLFVSTSSHMYRIELNTSKEGDQTRPAERLDRPINPYNSIFEVVPSPVDGFSFSTFAEGVAPTAFFSENASLIRDLWEAEDYAQSQFCQSGKYWISASADAVRIARPTEFWVQPRIKRYTEDWSGEVKLIPGASGRLAWLNRWAVAEDSPGPASQWIDPLSEKILPTELLPDLTETRFYWVDQGHVFSEESGKIIDHGRLRTINPVRASEDAVALSPWAVWRSEDRLTLTVQSIYRGGPQYTLRRPGRLWTQLASPYGLHALYDDGDFFDLRTGKLAATLHLSDDESGEFAITIPNGSAMGTPVMLAKLGIAKPRQPENVLAVLEDLLVLRTQNSAMGSASLLDMKALSRTIAERESREPVRQMGSNLPGVKAR